MLLKFGMYLKLNLLNKTVISTLNIIKIVKKNSKIKKNRALKRKKRILQDFIDVKLKKFKSLVTFFEFKKVL